MPWVKTDVKEHIKDLTDKQKEAWVKIANGARASCIKSGKSEKFCDGYAVRVANSKAKGIQGFEVRAGFESPRELTKKDIESYDLDPTLLQRPNLKVIEGDLCLIDTEFTPETVGMGSYKRFFITEEAVKNALPSLSNTPIHITGTDFKGHSVVDPDTGEKKFISIGSYLGGKIVKDGDDRICRVLGGIWEENHPKEAKAISENKDKLGQSFEIAPNLESLEEIDEETATIHDFLFKGGAILQKNLAAFPQTQLLIAQKAEDKKPKIQVISDGTPQGTKFLLNGKEIANMRSFSISHYDNEKNLSCSFTVKEEGVDGFVKEERYYLERDEIKMESADGKPAGRNIPDGGKGLGIGGKCVCPKCGVEIEHKTAKPCYEMKCPKCGAKMTRKTSVKGGGYEMNEEGLEMWFPEISAVRWTRESINNLPNSVFAIIEPDYLSGKTDNKNARHLPYKGADGKVDLPHLRNALARMNQIDPITDSISAKELRAKAKAKLTSLAKQYLPNSKWAKEGGVKGMGEKIYSQEELDTSLEKQKKEFESGQVLAGKEKEIVGLTAKVKELDEKIVVDAKTAKEKDDAGIRATKEKDAQIAAERWFEDNKDIYPEEKKADLIAIRKKIELGEVKKEEIETLLKEKRADVNALLSLGEDTEKATEKQLDTLFSIEDASEVKVG